MRSGLTTLSIEPQARDVAVADGQTLLDAALAAGINLPHSCKSGHCASCRARLIEGRIEYRDGLPLGLTAAEASAGQVLLCQARAATPHVRVEARSIARAGEADIRTLPCRIAARRTLSDDVLQLLLRLPATETVSFAPGQYLDVLLEGGRRRSFSIASPPHDAALLELHVRRVPEGAFTRRLFDELTQGALLRIELPIGQFIYQSDSRPMLAIAGGTGFAPLKSMLRHLLETESADARPVHLFWGARTRRDLYEQALVLDWVACYAQFKFTAVVSEEAVADDDVSTSLQSGWVHEAVLRTYPVLTPFAVYAAGPPQMIEAIRASFPRAGLDPTQLFFDSFDYAPR
jgi:CDP-4-dehydro-6-deoxyglucose reductase